VPLETRFRAVTWDFAAGTPLVWLAVLARSGLSTDEELLVRRQENQVLRRQMRGRPRWDHVDRLWLAAWSRLVHRRRWTKTLSVTPATILRWHRSVVARKWTFTDQARGGRVIPGAGRPGSGPGADGPP
jgi:hypothetical protein